MSAIQLLEKIGATANLRQSPNEMLSELEIENLIDICPDVYCIMAPAEDEEDDDDSEDESDDGEDGEDGDDKGNDDDECDENGSQTKSVVNF